MCDGRTEDIEDGECGLCRITATLCYMKTTEKHFRSLKTLAPTIGPDQNGKAISLHIYRRIDTDINNEPDLRGLVRICQSKTRLEVPTHKNELQQNCTKTPINLSKLQGKKLKKETNHTQKTGRYHDFVYPRDTND